MDLLSLKQELKRAEASIKPVGLKITKQRKLLSLSAVKKKDSEPPMPQIPSRNPQNSKSQGPKESQKKNVKASLDFSMLYELDSKKSKKGTKIKTENATLPPLKTKPPFRIDYDYKRKFKYIRKDSLETLTRGDIDIFKKPMIKASVVHKWGQEEENTKSQVDDLEDGQLADPTRIRLAFDLVTRIKNPLREERYPRSVCRPI